MSPPGRRRLAGPLLLIGTLLAFVGIDRALLAHYGLPLWEADPSLYFRHRPDQRRTWPSFVGGKPLRTNHDGFFDDDFPRAKPPGEYRALALGDSVIMGHGVTTAEALPNRLEDLLRARHGASPGPFQSYQVINAGVQGYWTEQYVEVLRRNLDLDPDLIIVGFSLNDVVPAYRVDIASGGDGLDYHGVQPVQTSLLSYLVNETGFGRLAIALRSAQAARDQVALRQQYSVERVSQHSYDDREVIDGWRRALGDLAEIYRIARERDRPVVLVILPYRFQLGHPTRQEPQRILARHAEQLGVPYLDTTPLLEAALARGVPREQLFLDGSHLQVGGHALLAEHLLAFLHAQHLIDERAAPRHVAERGR